MRLLIGRLAAAAAGGASLYAAFPPLGWWPAAFVGPALLVVALGPLNDSEPGARTGAGIGFTFGFVFFLLLLPWVGLYVGDYAWWALATVEALYLAAFGAGAVHLVRRAARGSRAARGRRAARGLRQVGVVVAVVVGLAAWWSLWESIRGSWPWGGFPWGSLAFSHADGPLLPLASVGGARFLGAVIAASGFAIGLAILALLRRATAASALAPLTVPVAVLALAALVPVGAADRGSGGDGNNGGDGDGTDLRVAVIQGNVPRLGLDFNSQRAAVLDNHLAETHRLADDVAAGAEPRPDLVLWPENASDVPALDDDAAAAALTEASVAVGAPIFLGTIDRLGGGPDTLNTQLLWDGSSGPVDRHDKKYIQPFGEWLPWRDLIEALFPIAENAGHFVPGEGDGTVDVAGVTAGTATCFEVAFDAAARDPVSGGAQILTVPTNNATFGHSPMSYQQLAMSRVRAVEHDVPVLVAATSGVSAIISADGTVEQETEIFEAATLTADLRLDGAGTLATQVGAATELALGVLGAVAVIVALVTGRRELRLDRVDDARPER